MGIINALSVPFQEAVDEHLEKITDNVMDITCTFFSAESDYKFVADYINGLAIVRNFTGSYTDLINLTVDFRPNEYVELVKNIKDLRCELVLKHYDTNTQEVGEVIKTIDQRAIIKNREDILKKFPKGVFTPDETFTANEEHQSSRLAIEFDLIDNAIYLARKQRLHFILRKATVAETIKTIHNLYGFEKIYIVPPDNTEVYTNMIIPPMMSIGNIFKWLQHSDAYGVYELGLSYYYTEKTLYVYPLFDPSPVITDGVVNIYDVGLNLYTGLHGYHTVDGKDTHVISNTGSTTIAQRDTRLENEGNSFVNLRPMELTDNWVDVQSEHFFFLHQNVEQINQYSIDGISDEIYTPTFVSTENSYRLKAELASATIDTVTLGWAHATPFTFFPGGRVAYHYENDKGEYTKVNAVCTEVSHRISPSKTLSKKVYVNEAMFTLLLANES